MSDNQQFLTLEQAARHMQTTPLNVLMHIKRGLLQGEERSGQWYVEEKVLTDFLQQGEKATVTRHGNCSRCKSCE